VAALEQSHFEDEAFALTPPLDDHLRDASSKDGALRLKGKIENYWRDRGFPVCVTVHHVGFLASMRSARSDLRSDMRNGFPQAALPAPEERS